MLKATARSRTRARARARASPYYLLHSQSAHLQIAQRDL